MRKIEARTRDENISSGLGCAHFNNTGGMQDSSEIVGGMRELNNK